MSILKSTKAGKSGIPLTLYYLMTQGWYEPIQYNSYTGKTEQDTTTICPGPIPSGCKKNPSKFLNIYHDSEGVARMYLEIRQKEKAVNDWGIKPEYTYTFNVDTLGDLDLVLAYWNEQKKTNRKRALRDKIINQSKKESMLWFSKSPF
jgi:hypothetical protein